MPNFPWFRNSFRKPKTRPAPARLGVVRLDDRINPTAILATGAGEGEAPTVTVYDAATMSQLFTFTAYDATFTGGVNVAVGDVTGDGRPDIITGAGTGGGPEVNVFDGTDGTLLATFNAGDDTTRGGVNVSVADFDADGIVDIVAGTVRDGAPLVQVLRYADRSSIREYFPATGTAAPTVAAGDVNMDGTPDVMIGAGVGDAPRVIVYDGSTGSTLMDLLTFEDTFTGGVRVSAGDLNADGAADVITAAGFLGGPRVQVFDGQTQAVLQNFFAYDSELRAGVYASAADTNADGVLELLTANGSGQAADPKAFSASDLTALTAPATARLPVGAAFDTAAPTVTVTAAVVATKTAPVAFAIAFSEPVNGFSEAGLLITNGSVAVFSRVDASNYTVTVTPAADGSVTVAIAAGAAFDPAGNTNAAAEGGSAAYDTVAPTVTANTLNAASTTPTLTGTVSETATVVVTVDGQTVPATVSGSTWSAVVPTALLDGTYDIAVTATDAAGNSASASAVGGLVVDTAAPSVTVESSAEESTADNPIPFTVTFSEDVTGFTADDLTITNGSVLDFTAVDARTFSVTVVPGGTGTVTVAVSAGVANDPVGIGNTAGDPLGREFTGTVTAATISTTETSTTTASSVPVTVTFDGDVTGFTADSISATNGIIAAFTAVDARTYTFTVTATTDGTVTVTVPAGAGTDAAGNPTAGATLTYLSDRTGPTATVTSSLASTNAGTVTFNVFFNEDATGFTAEDVTVVNGSVTSFTAEDARTYRIVVTPVSQGTVSLTVPAAAATDDLGNASTVSGTVSVTYDTTAPTAALAGTDGTVGGTAVFTLSFSEAVVGVTADDFTVVNGTVTSVTATGTTTYQISVTPTAAGTVTVTLPAGNVTDAAGNALAAAATASATATGVTNSAGLSTTLPATDDTGWTVYDDGLRVRDVTVGSGTAVTSASSVTVHYTGWLLDGTVFDSSTDGDPITFALTGVIEGWQEGLVGMQPGGVRDLYIPAALAYGDTATGSIPAGSTLVFQVKLISIS